MYRLFFVLMAFILFSCKKEKYIPPVSPSPGPVNPAALLKNIVIPNLPSPYYHFEYDSAGKVVFVSFASDFTRYNVVYNGARISEMKNNIIVNKDRLQYSYDNEGRINTVAYADSTGLVYTRLNLRYDGRKLVEINRERKSGSVFIIDKTLTMSYYPDGNLLDLTYHYLPFNGQPEATYTDRFEQYDNKMNVEFFFCIPLQIYHTNKMKFDKLLKTKSIVSSSWLDDSIKLYRTSPHQMVV